MYLSHFELHEKPFKISTDPKFLWLGEKHKEALATLLYGILYNDGYVVVTGDVGTGKTTLASALMTELAGKVVAVKVPFPDFESLDFFKLISTAYGIGDGFQSKGSFFELFGSFLRRSSSAGKKVVLIIDEAQRLSSEHLKELLHLSNIEENGARLLNVVFVGQNEFNGILLEEANRPLRQRITINYNLASLTQEETGQYIAHRLLVAQGKAEIFPPEAVEEVFSFSEGIPRLINVVCDLALLLTYFVGEKIVRPKTVKESAERLRLPSEKPADRGNGAPLVSGAEEAIQIAIEEKDREEGKPEAETGRGRRPFWRKALYGAGGVILILGVGLFLLNSGREEPGQGAKTQEAKSERDLPTGPVQKEPEESGEKTASAPGPSAVKETSPAAETVKGSDPPPTQAEPKVPAASKAGREPGIQEGIQKKKEPIGPKAPPGSARQPASDPIREKGESRQQAKPSEDRGKTISGEQKGRPSPSPAFTPDREPASQGTDEMDPNKVIEWLLERRSDKR